MEYMSYASQKKIIIPLMKERFVTTIEVQDMFDFDYVRATTMMNLIRRNYKLEIIKVGRYNHYKIICEDKKKRTSEPIAINFEGLAKEVEVFRFKQWWLQSGQEKRHKDSEGTKLYKLAAKDGIKVYRLTDEGKRRYLN